MAGVGSASPAITSARKAGSTAVSASGVASKAYSRKLPAGGRREEIAVGGAAVAPQIGAAAALQHHLPAHELAIIFAARTFGGFEARVGKVGAGGPLPDVPENA